MKSVGVISASGAPADLRLLALLGDVFSVQFVARTYGALDGLDAVLLIGANDRLERTIRQSNIPCLIISEWTEPNSPRDAASVQFSSSSLTPAIFRNRALEQKELGAFQAILTQSGDSILASIEDSPAWTVSQSNGARIDHLGLSLPKFDESRVLFHYFEGFNFFRLLPLVDMLRRLTGEDRWSNPGLRACFIFDDPNLRNATYGWLNYGDIVRQAAKLNYHVAFATVPLDAWCASKKSAAYFAEHADRLSLLVHGNDHLHGELAGFASEQEALARLGQALQRIERLEKTFSIEIPRVMAAPHGACSEYGLRAMTRLGFEATTLAYGAFCSSNPGKAWAKRIGLRVCDVVYGMPSIPRFRFKYGQSFVLLSAYLNQAIIPYGHHQDVADGLGVLDNLAEFINSLGNVQWTDMGGVARSNYLTRQEGSVLHVKSYARLVRFTVPDGVKEVIVHCPWELSESEGLCIRSGAQNGALPAKLGEPISVRAADEIEIRFAHPDATNPSTVAKTNADAMAFARRQFCEIRDRFAPLTPAFLRP